VPQEARESRRRGHHRCQQRRVYARPKTATIAWDYPGRTCRGAHPAVPVVRPRRRTTRRGQEIVWDVTGRSATACPGPACFTVFARHPERRWVAGSTPLRAGSARVRPARTGIRPAHVTARWSRLPRRDRLRAAATSPRTSRRPPGVGPLPPPRRSSSPTCRQERRSTGFPWGGSWLPAAGLSFAGSARRHRRVARRARTPPTIEPPLRSRASDVTGLQVDVISAAPIQVMPGTEKRSSCSGATWPPFSWVPWFTSSPWVVAPLFVARRPVHGPRLVRSRA
jgi:hypothetical protein